MAEENKVTARQLLKTHWSLALGVFLLFAMGFFVFYGKESVNSGSWRYVISHDDEYLYWAMAKAVGQTPRSDGNAFFAEERGRSNPYLTNVTAITLGLVAETLGIPAIAAFPLWKIGMPFLSWLSMWMCLAILWRKPPAESAVVSLSVLLITLFIHGSAQFPFFRFPRPDDAIWLGAV